MSIIIGFGYKARHGKDTAAKAIIDKRGGDIDIRRYSFAEALKNEYTEACKEAGNAYLLIESMRVTHDLPSWVVYDFAADMSDPLCPYGKQRTLLQWWGSEYRRAIDPFYWVKKVAKKIKEESPTVALITDLRFPNEALFVKLNRGYTVEVRRDGYKNLEADLHPSEHMLDNYPWDICLSAPEGDTEQLRQEAVEVFDLVLSWNVPTLLEEPLDPAS